MKRFIAGAVCPRCGAMDRIHIYQKDGVQVKACVACDFEETMKLQVSPDELPTRVNHRTDAELAEQEEVSVVRLVSPGQKTNSKK